MGLLVLQERNGLTITNISDAIFNSFENQNNEKNMTSKVVQLGQTIGEIFNGKELSKEFMEKLGEETNISPKLEGESREYLCTYVSGSH